MASKVPVITSRDTSMAEILNNENALIDPSSPEELAAKMQEFLSRNMQEQIKLNYERAKDFSQEKFVKQILGIYKRLCQAPVKQA
jgi:glycosyltransferase involved in cell wall biosynthesis